MPVFKIEIDDTIAVDAVGGEAKNDNKVADRPN
jgi:hypothetical protein